MTQYYLALDESEFNATWHDPSSFVFYETPEEAREAAEVDYSENDTIYVFCVTIDLDKTYTKTWVES